MKKLTFDPMFLGGLVVRLALMFGIAPIAVTSWYAPFLAASTAGFTLDPWSAWLAGGGTSAAFPYGYAMWIVFLPMTLIAKVTGLPMQYAYGLTLLVADLALLFVLQRLLPGRHRLLLVVYWLSPIVILATYGLGFNDLVPALLLVLAVHFVRRADFAIAGAICAAAVSAKLSMVVALPFLLIYLYNNKALRRRIPAFLLGMAAGGVVLGVPFVLSANALRMLLSNPEMGKVYRLAVSLDGALAVYVVPLAYVVMLYTVWRVRRLNFDLLQAAIGLGFLLIVLLTPASPGWLVWSIPFLVISQAMSDRVAIALMGLFSGLYVLSTLLVTPLHIVGDRVLDLGALANLTGGHTASLVYTTMVAVGAILSARIWREATRSNDFFRLSRKPFVIGVAGDSGAGKDTFADSIEGLFGGHSVVKLSGDDYHLWDRQEPMWQVMTHLNPMANDLEGFGNDLIALADGRSIQARRYDHQTGKMSRPFGVKSNDFIIVTGLHALHFPLLRECYNLKVYLDVDEGLRRYFKLQRDIDERGHDAERVIESFEKREPDSERFVRPQSAHADLILSLQPIHPRMLEDAVEGHPLRLKLVVRTRHGFNELSLRRILVGVCGLHVDFVTCYDGSEVQMTIEGETSSADIALAAEMVCPRVLEFLDIAPEWQDGMSGLMQLVTLSHINQALTRRFIQ